ncbi:putative inorganic polyphosphate/ATP-NAD kinase [uncultured delta proteobacterium]|uniref:NAD kinase n=1 Tax=uncultured delta proteobacterium TaxID=34034 RepID=A0A212J6M8_9DELT|nr:putative inorganic polyphosphate/ATP-NAD kinase [uncultured delta proteobacterium]
MNRHPVRNVALVARDASPLVQTLSHAMEQWFGGQGVTCAAFVFDHAASDFQARLGNADIVIVLGGDGTFVGVARKLAVTPRPILGVNLGRVGFLAEVAPDSWKGAFSRMIDSGVRLESGMALQYSLLRNGKTVWEGLAVNDLVVSRGGPARLVSLALTVDGIRLARLRADGLIVATPTGSTGYTSSARGPLLHPGINAYAVTPISPFMSNFSPMVVAGETRISIAVDAGGPGIYLTVDGQESLELQQGDTLKTTGHKDGICFARIDDESYFAKLRSAGFVRDFAE